MTVLICKLLDTICIFLLFILVASAKIVDRPDSNGKEFIFSFLSPLNEIGRPTEVIQFGSGLPHELFESTNVSARTSDGSLHKHTLLFSSHIHQFTALTLPKPRGIIINSSADIFVYGISLEEQSTDGFLALPTDVLTGNYTIIAPDDVNFEAEIAVTGVEDNTLVTISSPIGRQEAVFVLNRGETHQYSALKEISGFKVEADKKVAVLSGRKCLRIPMGFTACDHVLEMLPPTERLGHEFILAPLKDNCAPLMDCKSFFKITAAFDGTIVTRLGSDMREIYKLDAGQYRDIRPDSTVISLLTSTKPIITAIFAASRSFTGVPQGDPFFSLIPHMQAYASEYNVITCFRQFNPKFQYFNIEIKTTEIEGLEIENSKAHLLPTFSCEPVPGSEYSACSYRIPCESPGYSSPMFLLLRHNKPHVAFSLLAYGYREFESYGYIGGMRLPISQSQCLPNPEVHFADGLDNDCDGRIDEELRNFIDDDGDGVIDEDLATIIPVINAQNEINQLICTYAAPFSNPENIGEFSTSVSYQCTKNTNLTYTDNITDSDVCSYDLIRNIRLTDGCGNIADEQTQNLRLDFIFNQTHDVFQFPASLTFDDWNLAIRYISQNIQPIVVSQTCPGRDEPFVHLQFSVQQSKNNTAALYENIWDYTFCDDSQSIGIQKIFVKNDAALSKNITFSWCINTPFHVQLATVNFPTGDENHRVTYYCLINRTIELIATMKDDKLSCHLPIQSNPGEMALLETGFQFRGRSVLAAGTATIVYGGCSDSCGEEQGRGLCFDCKCLCLGNWTGDQCNHLRPPNPRTDTCNGNGILSCSCFPGYTGEFCETKIDYCNLPIEEFREANVTIGSICENYGTCISTSMGAHCVCTSGFQGDFCDSTVPGEKFVSIRCAVRNTTDIILPQCITGERCIADNIDCVALPLVCKHTKGWCIPFQGGPFFAQPHKSSFNTRYSGLIDNFEMFANLKAEVCHDNGDPVCTCDPGFTGEDCGTIFDYCHENMTDLNVDGLIFELCAPHGYCRTNGEGAFCECKIGWTGPLCDQPIPGYVSISVPCCLDDPCDGVEKGCPYGQRCLTDNLDCAFQFHTCSVNIGWCAPISTLIQLL